MFFKEIVLPGLILAAVILFCVAVVFGILALPHGAPHV